MTHAFFKGLLFLAAGSVIHAVGGEQDMRKMGGLRTKIPWTFWTMTVATFAIAGIPPLAGFFSKDEILHASFAYHPALGIIMLATAGLTAYYTFRMFFLAFHGEQRFPEEAGHHVHESPMAMIGPLIPLALGSIFAGYVGTPLMNDFFQSYVWPSTMINVHHELGMPTWLLMTISGAVGVLGIALAAVRYGSAPQVDPDARVIPGWSVLHHKYYVDEIYDAMFVNRTKDLGTLLGQFDAKVIDGLGVDGTGWLARFGSTLSMWWDKWIIDGLLNFGAKLTQLLSFPIRFLQTGTFSSYALLILVGLVMLLAYYQQHLHVVLRGAR